MNFPKMLAVGRAVVTVVAATGTGACSLMQPHITGDDTFRSMALDDPHATPPADAATSAEEAKVAKNALRFYGKLPFAIAYADDLRLGYEQGYRDHSLARNLTALGVIPATVTALYLGFVNNAAKETTAPIGFASAGLIGMTGYFTSKQVQKIYVDASQKIGCSIISSRPYLLTMSEYTERLKNPLETLNRLLPAPTPNENADIKKYRDAYNAGLSFRAKVDLAPSSLIMSADAIRLDTDRKLIDNTSNLDQLPSTISAIGQMGQTITSVPKVPPASSSNKPAEANPNAMRFVTQVLHSSNPKQDAIDLQDAAAKISELVNERAALATQISQLPICTAPGTAPLTLTPSDSPIIVKIGSPTQVKVTGGTGVPKASFVGTKPDEKSLTMDVKIVGGDVLIVLTGLKDGTKATVAVSDAPGEYKKTFDVEVQK